MKHLDKLSLGVRGQTMGEDMGCPPVASPAMADQVAPSSNAPQESFDALWKTLVHLGTAIRWEQDPTSFKFTLHSWDLPLGAPLHAALPTSALRQHIQMLHHLDAKPDFAVDFCLPSQIGRNPRTISTNCILWLAASPLGC